MRFFGTTRGRVRAAVVAAALAVAGTFLAPAASATAEVTAAPLTANVLCYQGHPWMVTCQGFASGGVAPYQYGFQRDTLPWGYQSSANWVAGCYNNPGWIWVTLRVRDARGVVATAEDTVGCYEVPL